MNLKLVLLLSTIALVTAVARLAPGRFFLHGFLVGLLNWVWVAASHLLLFDAYAARHAQDLAGMQSLAGLPGWMRRYGIPIPGASGVMIGGGAWLLARIPVLRKRATAARSS